MMFTRRMLLKIAAVALLHPALRWTAPDPIVVCTGDIYWGEVGSIHDWAWVEVGKLGWQRHWSEISKMTIPELRAAGPFLA